MNFCTRRIRRLVPAAAVLAVPVVLAAAVLAVAPAGAAAGAGLWPQFRHGKWHFARTVNGRKVETTRCVNPTEEMKRQNAMLTKAGCALSPVRRSGNTYTFAANCSIHGLKSRSTSVMTVQSPDAYQLTVTGTQDGVATREVLIARRVGNCAR